MKLAYNHTPESSIKSRGFTIVELLIVIVVIGILAGITMVAYNNIQANAAISVLKSDLKNASTYLNMVKVQDGEYPSSDSSLSRSDNTNFEYTKTGGNYCLTAWSEAARTSFHISSESGTIEDGTCSGHIGYSGGTETPENQGIVTTLAGSAYGYADGTGTAARFNIPTGITVDSTGTLYVADNGNHRIRKITPSGEVTTLAGSTQGYADGTGTAAQFNYPRGIAVDSTVTLYVADFNNHRIRKITPAGEVTTLAGSTQGYADGTGSSAQFNGPYGIAVDSTGTVYVADFNNHRIRKITPSGEVTTLAGSTAGYADGTGSSAQFYSPTGIAVDSTGTLYVAEYSNHRIRKVTPSGEVTTLAGSTAGYADGTGSSARFNRPYGVAVDSTGTLYVADRNNHRIRKVTPSGEVTTLAGSTQGYADGTGSSARFSLPIGIAVDSTGTLYVADNGNHLIRKIE